MAHKYRFPDVPHIAYSGSRPFNNLVKPPTYSQTPEMSQTSCSTPMRDHLVPEGRTSTESDAGEDEHLASLEKSDLDLQPQLPFTIHPTLWLRLFSAGISFGGALTMLLFWNRSGPSILLSVSFLIGTCWNLLILGCNSRWLQFETRPLSTTGASADDKKFWHRIGILVEVAIILGAVIATIILCVTTLPVRHFTGRLCARRVCPNFPLPGFDAQTTIGVFLGAIGITIELLSLCLDTGVWRSCMISFIPKTGLNSYVFRSIHSLDQFYSTITVYQNKQCEYNEPKTPLSISINLVTRTLSMCLLPLTAVGILVPGYRQHDVLVVFLILMALTNCLIILKQLYFAMKSFSMFKLVAVPLKIEEPKKEFPLKPFFILWHAILMLGSMIALITSLTKPSREFYAGKWWIGREFPWIILASVGITFYAIATIDSLHPASIYIRFSGDLDIISTWCLRFGLKLKHEKNANSAKLSASQDSSYYDNGEETVTKRDQAESDV